MPGGSPAGTVICRFEERTGTLGDHTAASAPIDSSKPATSTAVPFGIAPLDDRTGGLQSGGSYLIVGAPGPAKMVAALQFLQAGLKRGEKCLLLSNADVEDMLGVGRGWGFDLESPWRQGQLQLLGFKDDFELRAIRSIEPDEVLEELDALVEPGVARIAVEPCSMFLAGGAKSVLGAAYLKWARTHPATACSTGLSATKANRVTRSASRRRRSSSSRARWFWCSTCCRSAMCSGRASESPG